MDTGGGTDFTVNVISYGDGSWPQECTLSTEKDNYAYSPPSECLLSEDRTTFTENLEVDDASDESTSDLESVRHNSWTFRECIRSKPCLVCSYLILTLLALSSLLTVAMVTAVVVMPYRRVSDFVYTTCLVLNSSSYPMRRRCSACTGSCGTVFPCITIYIRVLDSQNDWPMNSSNAIQLHDDETYLDRKCTVYPHCKSTEEETEAKMKAYQSTYGSPSSNISCFYNSRKPGEVIRTKRFQFHEVVHGVLWPAVVLLGSTCSLVILFRRRRCGFKD